MSMYLLLVAAAMLFAVQFIFNQKYKGEGCDAALLFQIYVAVASGCLMLLLNRFYIKVTLFSVIIAAFYAVDIILYIYFSLKAFANANLSVYSIFAMLGGMILPFVYGTVFCDEGITVFKVISFVLIVVSLVLTYSKGNSSRKCMRYYLAVFFFNGMMGVISKIHQSNVAHCTDSRSFLAITYAYVFIIALVWYFVRNRKVKLLSAKESAFSLGYALSNGIAEMLCLIALTKLPASVQYPMITGGVILFSTIVSAVTEKQRSAKSICSATIALLATIVIVLYPAAKGGLKMLTKNIASEYGEYNIQCNGIGPGYIATPQTAPLREIQPDGERHPFDKFIIAKTPAARWGTPEDLEGPAVFLASDASNFVNGHILYVDGGILAYIGKQP